jgi:hypothetical protein
MTVEERLALWEGAASCRDGILAETTPTVFCGSLRSQGSGFRVRGSGFRKSTRAIAIVFGNLPYGRLGPAAIGFGQLLLS